VANQRIDYQPAQSPLAQGSYRALVATANNFARESHIDELAHRLRRDPVDFRLANLADERLAGVLREAAEYVGRTTDHDNAGRGIRIVVVGSGFLLVSIVLWVTKFVVYERVICSPSKTSAETVPDDVDLRAANTSPHHVVGLRGPSACDRDAGATSRVAQHRDNARHSLPAAGCAHE